MATKYVPCYRRSDESAAYIPAPYSEMSFIEQEYTLSNEKPEFTITKPFRFLDLPPEIREKVYQYYYTAPCVNFTEPSNYVPLFTTAAEFPTGLLSTCYQLYCESRHYYFSINSFSIVIERGKFKNQFNWFLEDEFRDNRLLIPALRLTIDRWGIASWFLNTFLHCLEDMILNGRLRELEVRLPSHHPQDDTTLELKRLCEDPYLEKVTVKTYDRNQLRRLRQPLFDIGEIWLTDITEKLDRSHDGSTTVSWKLDSSI